MIGGGVLMPFEVEVAPVTLFYISFLSDLVVKADLNSRIQHFEHTTYGCSSTNGDRELEFLANGGRRSPWLMGDTRYVRSKSSVTPQARKDLLEYMGKRKQIGEMGRNPHRRQGQRSGMQDPAPDPLSQSRQGQLKHGPALRLKHGPTLVSELIYKPFKCRLIDRAATWLLDRVRSYGYPRVHVQARQCSKPMFWLSSDGGYEVTRWVRKSVGVVAAKDLSAEGLTETSQTTNKAADTSVRNSDAGSKEENGIPPAVVPTGTSEEKQVAADSLGDVGSKVQQEIGKEFAAMMASGTVRATEAAALAPAGPTTCMGYLEHRGTKHALQKMTLVKAERYLENVDGLPNTCEVIEEEQSVKVNQADGEKSSKGRQRVCPLKSMLRLLLWNL
ncbi:hypothetical protein Tco_0624892 [Tanacetum coccineum]|uniref:Uncharacterized protein n=1 Tax=Tanacetum coccineum TaxID=301880 RepID=A0ABQ4WFA3_9ASTR